MLYCPLCCTEILIWNSLCVECSKIKRLCALYSRDEVVQILDNVLLRKSAGIKNKIDAESDKYKVDIRKIK